MLFNIELDFKENSSITEFDYSFDYINDSEGYDFDSLIVDICNIFYDSEKIYFKIGGFGETDWGADCKTDLPCVLEQMDVILQGIKNKEKFEIDFYEQGMERTLEFLFDERNVSIKCSCYINWIPQPPIVFMSYDAVYKLFIKLYNNFLECINMIIPKIQEIKLFKDWIKSCEGIS